MYLLVVINPPKKVIECLHKIFANFFGGGKIDGAKVKHWVKWEELCFPREEGALGFKSLYDVNSALFAKLW